MRSPCHWLAISASVLLGIAGAYGSQHYFERPTVFSPFLNERGIFTVEHYFGGIRNTDPNGLPPPEEKDDPLLAAFCHEAERLALAKKCPQTRKFYMFSRNGPWYPSGWPFISQEYGFLVALEENDCRTKECPKYWEMIIAEDGGSRFRLSGFLGNSVVFSASAFILIRALRHACAIILLRRRGRKEGFPVTIVNSADRSP